MFYSDFGSFIHALLASYYTGAKSKSQIIGDYITNFRSMVLGRAPSQAIWARFFNQGLTYLQAFEPFPEEILGVERKIDFHIGDQRFTGFIDLLLKGDRGLVVLDHKSHDLKPRSQRTKPTRSDRELDEYLRQLYLYSAAIMQLYGAYPAELVFNCYRTGVLIREPFSAAACDEAQKWALDSISEIENQTSWRPNLDYYYCNYICDCHDECEYYAIEFGQRKRRGRREGGDDQ